MKRELCFTSQGDSSRRRRLDAEICAELEEEDTLEVEQNHFAEKKRKTVLHSLLEILLGGHTFS